VQATDKQPSQPHHAKHAPGSPLLELDRRRLAAETGSQLVAERHHLRVLGTLPLVPPEPDRRRHRLVPGIFLGLDNPLLEPGFPLPLAPLGREREKEILLQERETETFLREREPEILLRGRETESLLERETELEILLSLVPGTFIALDRHCKLAPGIHLHLHPAPAWMLRVLVPDRRHHPEADRRRHPEVDRRRLFRHVVGIGTSLAPLLPEIHLVPGSRHLAQDLPLPAQGLPLPAPGLPLLGAGILLLASALGIGMLSGLLRAPGHHRLALAAVVAAEHHHRNSRHRKHSHSDRYVLPGNASKLKGEESANVKQPRKSSSMEAGVGMLTAETLSTSPRNVN